MKPLWKNLSALFLVLTAVLGLGILSTSVQAASSGTVGTFGSATQFTWTLDDNGTLTISGEGTVTENTNWSQSSEIKAVVIEEGMGGIGEKAFYSCTNLSSVSLPDSLTWIGGSAFRDCGNLKSTSLPSGMTSIGEYAFYNSGLTSVTIPGGVTSIANYAFGGCPLTSVTISDGVTSIGLNAFYSCQKLTSVTIPDSVTSMANAAFSSCTSLTSVTISSGLTGISELAFYDCESLKSVTIPAGVTEVGAYAFADCKSLTSVTIPSGVTSVWEKAFFDCDSLMSVTIPASVTNFGGEAFGYKADDAGNSVRIDGFTIYGYTGSAAETYATSYDRNITFVALDKTTLTVKNKVTLTASTKKKQTVTLKVTASSGAKVTFSNFKSAGTATATYKNGKITFPKKFVGKVTIKATAAATGDYKKATKTITIKVNPPKTTLSSAKNTASKTVTVKWKKNSLATGYQIQYSTSKKFTSKKTVKVKKAATTSTTIGKLTKGKTYYVRIRTYTTVSGKTYYSSWSTAKKVKITKKILICTRDFLRSLFARQP